MVGWELQKLSVSSEVSCVLKTIMVLKSYKKLLNIPGEVRNDKKKPVKEREYITYLSKCYGNVMHTDSHNAEVMTKKEMQGQHACDLAFDGSIRSPTMMMEHCPTLKSTFLYRWVTHCWCSGPPRD